MLNSKDIFIIVAWANAHTVNAPQKSVLAHTCVHTHLLTSRISTDGHACWMKSSVVITVYVCVYYHLIYGDFVLRKKGVAD